MTSNSSKYILENYFSLKNTQKKNKIELILPGGI